MRLIDEDEFVKNVVKYSHQSLKTIGQALADTPTACEIFKMRSEIAQLKDHEQTDANTVTLYTWKHMQEKVLQIIDKYTNGGMSPEVKGHYERLAEHYDKKKGGAI